MVVSGSEEHTTNNRMELTAAIEALRSCDSGERVVIRTDSQYVRRGMTEWISNWKRQGWRRGKGQPVLNHDLWMALDAENERVSVDWQWIKAHAGNEHNESVDTAARDAALNRYRVKNSSSKGESIAESTIQAEQHKRYDFEFFLAASNVGSIASAWAYIRQKESAKTSTCEVLHNATLNHALLSGAISAVQSLPSNACVSIATESEYLFRGVTQWRHGWRQRHWRKADGGKPQNIELWMELDQELTRVEVDWRLATVRAQAETFAMVRQARTDAREELRRLSIANPKAK